MLVLKNIKSNNVCIDSVVIMDNDSTLSFDIFDTESRKVYTSQSLNKEIFGVVYDKDRVIAIAVDDATWNLLDYVDSPAYAFRIHRASAIDKVINDYYNDVLSVRTLRVSKVYECESKNVIVVNLGYNPLDENNIFWIANSGMCCTLLSLYKHAFESCTILGSEDVYVRAANGNVYKLDINNKVIRFMTKIIALRK